MKLIAGCHKLVPGHYKCFNSWSRYHYDRSVPSINTNTDAEIRKGCDLIKSQLCSLKGGILPVLCVWHNYRSQSSQKWLSCLTIMLPKYREVKWKKRSDYSPGPGIRMPGGQRSSEATRLLPTGQLFASYSICFLDSCIQYIFDIHRLDPWPNWESQDKHPALFPKRNKEYGVTLLEGKTGAVCGKHRLEGDMRSLNYALN